MNAVAVFLFFDLSTQTSGHAPQSTRVIPAYTYATAWTEGRHEQKRKEPFGPMKALILVSKPCQIAVSLEVVRHQLVGMLIAFLVRPQPNIAVVDLNGNHSHMLLREKQKIDNCLPD